MNMWILSGYYYHAFISVLLGNNITSQTVKSIGDCFITCKCHIQIQCRSIYRTTEKKAIYLGKDFVTSLWISVDQLCWQVEVTLPLLWSIHISQCCDSIYHCVSVHVWTQDCQELHSYTVILTDQLLTGVFITWSLIITMYFWQTVWQMLCVHAELQTTQMHTCTLISATDQWIQTYTVTCNWTPRRG